MASNLADRKVSRHGWLVNEKREKVEWRGVEWEDGSVRKEGGEEEGWKWKKEEKKRRRVGNIGDDLMALFPSLTPKPPDTRTRTVTLTQLHTHVKREGDVERGKRGRERGEGRRRTEHPEKTCRFHPQHPGPGHTVRHAMLSLCLLLCQP